MFWKIYLLAANKKERKNRATIKYPILSDINQTLTITDKLEDSVTL